MSKTLVNGLFSSVSDAELAALSMNAEFYNDFGDSNTMPDAQLNASASAESINSPASARNDKNHSEKE
jgi:hypothetical protein